MIFGRIIQCVLIPKLARRVTVNDSSAINSSLIFGVVENKHPFVNSKWCFVKTMATSSSVQSKYQNRLAYERSPYLLQHATNPVDWYPWGDEAFEKAKKEDKLIFLSVGYSTCHWCHVMERESFENEDIARVMNEHFVNIKVDREERPDVDRMYMTFVQATAGGGGWPMSVWLTPDLTPVYGGTYYPPDDRYYGRPGFKTLLGIISEQWHKNRQKFAESGARITEVLKRTSLLKAETGKMPGPECAEKCMRQLSQMFESQYGGFGDAPKFPQAPNLEFLFHEYARDPDSEQGQRALHMCTHTLLMMAKGGIHDHVAQGFARYSTDDQWHVPHFEKMLYDQAQLAMAYSNAYIATKDELFANVLRDIILYVDRDLGHQDGGFFSAEDADSLPTSDATHKREGAFCVWTHDEVQQLLAQSVEGHEDLSLSELFCHHYDVQPEGNVDPYKDPHEELKRQNVLIVRGSEAETAEHFQLPLDAVQLALRQGRELLFTARQQRPRPHRDDKIITSWNGLMISGLARAGEALGEPTYVRRAARAAEFVRQHLLDPHSCSLLRSCYRAPDGGVAQIPGGSMSEACVSEVIAAGVSSRGWRWVRSSAPIAGFLCDYAFLVRGLLDLYEASLEPSWLEWAERLQERQDQLFWDEEGGGYFTSASGDASILFRSKEEQDGAEPAANGVSATSLQRLSALLERPELRERARRVLQTFAPRLEVAPAALPSLCAAARLLRDGPTAVVVSGSASEPATAALLAAVRSRLLPGRVLALADGRGLLHERCEPVRRMAERPARAYVCRRRACSLPVADPQALGCLLDRRDSPGHGGGGGCSPSRT